jgi:alcohol dehydrogenase
MGSWGGAISDLLRVPYADAMLVPVPPNIDPMKLASASDNLPDAWRTVGPPLRQYPHASVLVIGGGARSIGLYSAGMAVALGASRVDYVDHDTERLEIAERLGAHPIQCERGSRWLKRNAPRVHGTFRVTVEASSTVEGLRYALRSMAPGGICTPVGYYLTKKTGVPLLQMYVNDATLKIGVSHTRTNLPDVIALVGEGKFDPTIVTTLVADWNDAPAAFATPTTKVVVKRSE